MKFQQPTDLPVPEARVAVVLLFVAIAAHGEIPGSAATPDSWMLYKWNIRSKWMITGGPF